MCNRNESLGFTLIELIIVIVILSIVAVIGSQFIVSATESYHRTQARALLTNTGRLVIERMVRQLRVALPYSVRITNGGNCLQFMPIATGGFYTDLIDTTQTITTLNTGPYSVEFGVANNITVGALTTTELYGAAPISLSPVTATGATSVSFQAQMWQRNSQVQRFFLVNNPQAFCLSGGRLLYFENLNPVSSSITLTGFDGVLARNAAAVGGGGFVIGANSAENNIRVTFNLTFSESGESVNFLQEVALRNVP